MSERIEQDDVDHDMAGDAREVSETEEAGEAETENDAPMLDGGDAEGEFDGDEGESDVNESAGSGPDQADV